MATTAVARAKINLPTDVHAEMAAEIAALANRTAPPTGVGIKLKADKRFHLPTGDAVPDRIQCIVVDFVAANTYYPSGYTSSGDNDPAACFSRSLEPAGMTPGANAPQPQAGSCASCPQNQYGTAPTGKGKACTNNRLLAVLPLDADASSPLWLIRVAPTAINDFDAYVNRVGRQYSLPVRGVVTEISYDPAVDYVKLRFNDVEPATKDMLLLAHSRKAEALTMLLADPYLGNAAASNEEFAPAPAAVRSPAPRAAARR